MSALESFDKFCNLLEEDPNNPEFTSFFARDGEFYAEVSGVIVVLTDIFKDFCKKDSQTVNPLN